MANPMPRLAAPRAIETLEMVKAVSGGQFDPDVWHVMEARDDQLFGEAVMHGALTPAFLYVIKIEGRDDQVGVSAVGARHLAAHYKGLQFRLVADAHTVGGRVYCQQYPGNGLPYDRFVREADPDEPDSYMVLGEMHDIKTGNSFQAVRRELRMEKRRNSDQMFERPNYQTIAQSKVERNLILHMVPQDIRLRWQAELLKLGKGENITGNVIADKRDNVLRYAAANAIALDRRALTALTFEQISGLGDAAREGKLPAFAQSLVALGLATGEVEEHKPEVKPPPAPTRRSGGRQARESTPPVTEGGPPNEPPPGPPNEPAGDPPRTTGRRLFEE